MARIRKKTDILTAVAAVSLLLGTVIPGRVTNTDSALGVCVYLLLKMASLAPLFYALWIKEREALFLHKAVPFFFAVLASLGCDLPYKMSIAAELLLFFSFFAYCLYFIRDKNNEEHAKISERIRSIHFLVLMLIGLFFIPSNRYILVEKMPIPFLWVVIPSALAFAIYIFFKSVPSSRFVLALLSFLLGAFFIFFKCTAHINYVFDFSEPVTCEVTIEDKYKINRSKGADKYVFVCILNGKTVNFSVSSKEYFEVDMGDAYILNYYKGALGVPYYLY